MQESAIALLDEPETSLEREESAQLIEDMTGIFDTVASRAYRIFEGSGRLFGRDLDNWLKAEMEFLHPLHIEISETPEALAIRADVPGFKERDLKIDVEPRRVTIAGQRESRKESKSGKTVYSETCSDRILRVVDLPAAVNTKRVKTKVKDGVLELDLQKVEPDKHDQAESQPA